MSWIAAPRRFRLIVVIGLTLWNWSVVRGEEAVTEQEATPVPFQKIVEFDKVVHFLTSERKDVVIAPGEYLVEGGEKTVRLQPADNDETKAIVMQPETATHDRPMSFDILTEEQMAQSCPEEGAFTVAQVESQEASSGEVQERAVPANIEGVIVQGNQLRAAPGYVLGKGDDNQMQVRRKSGGNQSGPAPECRCTGSSGGCTVQFSGDVAICTKNPAALCTGNCEWQSTAHVPMLKPGALSGLAEQMPRINSILPTPPPSPYDPPPPGHINPFGTLYLKGAQFGSLKGKVLLHVQVPIDKHFHVGVGTTSLPGSKPGTRMVQLEVTQWGPDKITAKIPLIGGVPDHQAVLQVLNAQGLGSAGWNVPFHAMRARVTLQYNENVKKVLCSGGANFSQCLTESRQDTFFRFDRCFYGGPHVKDKTISGWHLNCNSSVDFDSGVDTYTIELKNGWVIEQVKWGWKRSSTSEKLNLPNAETLTQRYRGGPKMVLTVPWEVSPGPDWLAYWIDVDIKGPAGILYGDRVYWKQ